MSGEPEDKLSPEERLLKVIQGKDSAGVEPTKPDVPAASALTQTSSDVVTPAQAPPRLRTKPLKRQAAKPRKPAATPIVIPAVPNPAPTEPPSVESNSVPALEPSSPPSPVFGDDSPAEAPVVFADMGAEPPVIDEEPEEVPPSKGPRQFGISIVNTSIAALLMFTIVVIIAYELVAAFQSSDQAGIGLTPGSLPPVEEVGERGQLPDLQDLLASFNDRGFLAQEALEAPKADKPIVRASSLKQYVRENIVILGLSWTPDRSVQEAILMDRGGPRMHIVKPGDEISISGGTLRIERISDDAVIGHDGVEEIIIGKKKA